MLAGLAMTLSLALNLDPPAGAIRTWAHTVLAGITLACLVVFGRLVLRRALGSIVTLESLFLIGLLGAFFGSLHSSVTGTGHIYYEVVLVLLAIYQFGQTITRNRVERWKQIAGSVPGLTGEARRQVGGSGATELVPVAAVKAGDVIVVRPGEVIPVDGTIDAGRAYIEELPHTGEPFPAPRSEGEAVRAGTRVLDGDIRVRATAPGSAREIDRLHASLESRAQHSRVERLARRILRIFVPAVVVTAVATFCYWGLAVGAWNRAIFNALAVTIVACPCGLGLAIPLTVKRGLFQLRLLGIRDADSGLLERLAEVDTVVFDKTGTLSDGRLELVKWELSKDAPEALPSWLAAVQLTSTHPVARPFWDLAEPAELEGLEVVPIPARGIEATFSLAGHPHSLVIANDLYRSEFDDEERNLEIHRRLHVYLDGARVATVTLGESPRATARRAMTALRDRGVSIEIMTGDTAVPSEIAVLADRVHAGVSSEEKVGLVENRQQQGLSLLFVGDGLNDAEALGAADASLVIEGGSPVAAGSAQATLARGDLSAVAPALDLARALQGRLERLLFFVLGYNAVGIALAATGLLHPVVAALLMLGSSMTVLGCGHRKC